MILVRIIINFRGNLISRVTNLVKFRGNLIVADPEFYIKVRGNLVSRIFSKNGEIREIFFPRKFLPLRYIVLQGKQ